MARRTKIVVIDAEGRDQGRNYIIKEMPSRQAEEWAVRALMALIKAGIEIPDEAAQMGIAGLAQVGFPALTSIKWPDLKPLLDEMMDCVSFIPDPRKPMVIRHPLNDDDAEEVKTLITLRKEVLELHLGFSLSDATQKRAVSEQEQPQST